MEVNGHGVIGLIGRALRAGSRNGESAQKHNRQPEATASMAHGRFSWAQGELHWRTSHLAQTYIEVR
jgi:hypothetical protein